MTYLIYVMIMTGCQAEAAEVLKHSIPHWLMGSSARAVKSGSVTFVPCVNPSGRVTAAHAITKVSTFQINQKGREGGRIVSCARIKTWLEDIERTKKKE